MLWRMLLLINILNESEIVKGRYMDKVENERMVEPVVQDIPCSCSDNSTYCQECSRQVGEPCNEDKKCDATKHLVCRFRHGDSEGVCQEINGLSCLIHNKTYEHGETFSLDCRTQCTCQNGTYGCSSLCPQEQISPKGTCKHPRLVDVPGQCCREWLCDSQTEQPPPCQRTSSPWTACKSDCGSGISIRQSNVNDRCETLQEIRLCQTRRCEESHQDTPQGNQQHHIRRGHECKATHRTSSPVYLEVGPCRSKKRYRPKFCGICRKKGIECSPLLSTTVKVDFVCDAPLPRIERRLNLIFKNVQPGEDMWVENIKENFERKTLVTVSMQWILRCKCEHKLKPPVSTNGDVILHRVHRAAP